MSRVCKGVSRPGVQRCVKGVRGIPKVSVYKVYQNEVRIEMVRGIWIKLEGRPLQSRRKATATVTKRALLQSRSGKNRPRQPSSSGILSTGIIRI